MRKTLTALLIFFFTVSYCQTVIISKKTKNAVYVAADSRALFEKVDQFNHRIIDTGSICKIFTNKNNGFAISGATLLEEIKRDINIACVKDNYTDISRLFVNLYAVDFRDNAVNMKRDNSRYFHEEFFFKKRAECNIIYFGLSHDTLFNILMNFKVVNTDCDVHSEISEDTVLLMFGHVEEIRDTIKTKTIWKKGISKTLKSLVLLETLAHPIEVGGAIDIVKVDKRRKKIIWIQKKQICD